MYIRFGKQIEDFLETSFKGSACLWKIKIKCESTGFNPWFGCLA